MKVGISCSREGGATITYVSTDVSSYIRSGVITSTCTDAGSDAITYLSTDTSSDIRTDVITYACTDACIDDQAMAMCVELLLLRVPSHGLRHCLNTGASAAF